MRIQYSVIVIRPSYPYHLTTLLTVDEREIVIKNESFCYKTPQRLVQLGNRFVTHRKTVVTCSRDFLRSSQRILRFTLDRKKLSEILESKWKLRIVQINLNAYDPPDN